jgi:penicillin-binding protein A
MMKQRLARLAFALLLGFALMAFSMAYWGVWAADSMSSRNDNPRRAELELAIQRGAIYDFRDTVLASSQAVGRSPSGLPVMLRQYPLGGLVGYYTLRYGPGGIEAAYDSLLRGEPPNFYQTAAHQLQQGGDLKLTLDGPLSAALTKAFANLGRNGALVLLEAPSGAIRVLLSAPSFNPQQLDTTFTRLSSNPNAPLLNRAIQSAYQPGSALQTVILATMPPDQAFTQSSLSAALRLGQITLSCAGTTEPRTLSEAYQAACPTPFVNYALSDPTAFAATVESFGLLRPPALANLPTNTGALAMPAVDSAEAAGQGLFTVTPLQMALAAAAIGNAGVAVNPYLVEATRPAGQTWQPTELPPNGQAVITAEAAAFVQAAMRIYHQDSALTVWGHLSRAYTGQGINSWFVGLAQHQDGRRWAVAVLLEADNKPPSPLRNSEIFPDDAAIGPANIEDAARLAVLALQGVAQSTNTSK